MSRTIGTLDTVNTWLDRNGTSDSYVDTQHAGVGGECGQGGISPSGYFGCKGLTPLLVLIVQISIHLDYTKNCLNVNLPRKQLKDSDISPRAPSQCAQELSPLLEPPSEPHLDSQLPLLFYFFYLSLLGLCPHHSMPHCLGEGTSLPRIGKYPIWVYRYDARPASCFNFWARGVDFIHKRLKLG